MIIPTDASIDDLKSLVRTCPIVDNHAHNLLRLDKQERTDFLTLTTEATGDALQDAPASLAHVRALKQLRKLYNLPSDADWAAILRERSALLQSNPGSLIRSCLEGTQTLLIDDGLGSPNDLQSYEWHSSFTASPCKRIVRIETVAANILATLHRQRELPVGAAAKDDRTSGIAWMNFIVGFEQAITQALSDDEVVGFKSVVCYRTGLDVLLGEDKEVSQEGLKAFRSDYLPGCVSRDFRIDCKGMNDALVISTCKLISASRDQTGHGKPFQFHTGLGDSDISLLESNPAYLQGLVEQFSNVPFVLLHTSYPYTREAGYLATVYKNVYLDIGEVFMMVSRDGLEKIFRQALELTPTSKILYSTDGHHFPETFWLSNVHGRETMERVMCEYVEKGDLTVVEAMTAVRNILFENSNRVYNLGLGTLESDMSRMSLTQSNHTGLPILNGETRSNRTSSDPHLIPPEIDAKFVFVQWLDFLGQMRSRCLPAQQFEKLVSRGNRISISTGNLGTTQNDHMSTACNPVGAICVEPDVSSLRKMQDLGPVQHAATVMSKHTDEDGKWLALCPRSSLQRTLDNLRIDHKLHFLVGFEIEVTFCKRSTADSGETLLTPLDTNHAWGTMSDEQYTTAMPLLLTLTTAIQDLGIVIEQVHSEAGAGQYEFVLPPLPPIKAIDTLIQARQAISQIAATRNLRATYHPQPFPGIGTAAHAHISFSSQSLTAKEVENLEMSFMAAVLTHLPALCAFTMPQDASYERVVDNSWTSGTWVAWGMQNREVPIRRINSGTRRWEVRCLDGLANMYLALHAVFGAGLIGIEKGMEMKMGDCLKNPTQLTDLEKLLLGIATKLPKSLGEAVHALESDEELQDGLSPGIAQHYLAVKKAEQDMLAEMSDRDRRVWMMERY